MRTDRKTDPTEHWFFRKRNLKLSCVGKGTLDEFESLVIRHNERDMFLHNRDERGKFRKPEFRDGNGNFVGMRRDRVYDFDGDYDMWYCRLPDKMDDTEKELADDFSNKYL